MSCSTASGLRAWSHVVRLRLANEGLGPSVLRGKCVHVRASIHPAAQRYLSLAPSRYACVKAPRSAGDSAPSCVNELPPQDTTTEKAPLSLRPSRRACTWHNIRRARCRDSLRRSPPEPGLRGLPDKRGCQRPDRSAGSRSGGDVRFPPARRVATGAEWKPNAGIRSLRGHAALCRRWQYSATARRSGQPREAPVDSWAGALARELRGSQRAALFFGSPSISSLVFLRLGFGCSLFGKVVTPVDGYPRRTRWCVALSSSRTETIGCILNSGAEFEWFLFVVRTDSYMPDHVWCL